MSTVLLYVLCLKLIIIVFSQCESVDAIEADGHCYIVRGPDIMITAVSLCSETGDTFLNPKFEMQSMLSQITQEIVWTNAKWNAPNFWGKIGKRQKKGRKGKYYKYNFGQGGIVTNIIGKKVTRGGKRSQCLAYNVGKVKLVKSSCMKKFHVICKEGIWTTTTPTTTTITTTTTSTTTITVTTTSTTSTTTSTSTTTTMTTSTSTTMTTTGESSYYRKYFSHAITEEK